MSLKQDLFVHVDLCAHWRLKQAHFTLPEATGPIIWPERIKIKPQN